jgi:hypothetical protein
MTWNFWTGELILAYQVELCSLQLVGQQAFIIHKICLFLDVLVAIQSADTYLTAADSVTCWRKGENLAFRDFI